MPILARDNRKEFAPAPEGLHQAVCVDVVDLGLLQTPWGDKHKVELRWQIEATGDDGKRHVVHQRYSLSLNEKATLRIHLEAWRGKKFTKAELDGFDLELLIGVNCQLQVVHNVTDQGGVFANVQACVPLGRGMVKLLPQDYVRQAARVDGAVAADPDADDVPF